MMRNPPTTSVLLRAICVLALGLACAGTACAERIKDVANIRGVRNNQLIGYGLVVGLDGTGDQTTQTPFTVQSIGSMLSQLGINVPSGQNLQLKNVAAVMVTTQLPAFARPGQQIDRVINPTQAPAIDSSAAGLTGPARPSLAVRDSDFWAQGVNFSLELRF